MENVRVLSSDFLLSVFHPKDLPIDGKSEIAFLGRSNVGKSSLLNALLNRRSLAETSKTPGRTQAVNFFPVTLGREHEGREERAEIYFTDLPGFGYAKVPRQKRKLWESWLESYLFERAEVRQICLLVDIRREVRDEELYLASQSRPGQLLVILTKGDQVSRNEHEKARQKIFSQFKIPLERVFVAGLVGKAKMPVDSIRTKIAEAIPYWYAL